jgi:hypothetical protein
LSGHAPHYPGTAYVLLHSLSHSLMAEIALDCGYPELAERACVSAIRPTVPPNAAGLSLVGTAPRFAHPRGRIGTSPGSTRRIRSAPTINRTTAAAIAPGMELRVRADGLRHLPTSFIGGMPAAEWDSIRSGPVSGAFSHYLTSRELIANSWCCFGAYSSCPFLFCSARFCQALFCWRLLKHRWYKAFRGAAAKD